MAKKYTLSKLRNMDLSSFSEKELRQAYSTYRTGLNKRINRLAQGTQSQKAHAAPFLKGGSRELKEIKDLGDVSKRDLFMRVKEMQILEQKERMSLSGWKSIEKRTVESLKKAGYKNITGKNLKSFGEYMERMRGLFGNKIFPSDEAAEKFDEMFDEASDMDEESLLDMIGDWVEDVGGVDIFM